MAPTAGGDGHDNDISRRDSLRAAVRKMREGGLPVTGGGSDEPWLPDGIEEFDRDLYRWFAERDHGALDQALPLLTRAANHSVLWLGLAGALYLTGGRRGKATAVRGVIAVGVTSIVANGLVKRLPRARPPQEQIPEARQVRLPTSSSFPSGHAASAAAFATVVAHGEPGLLPPVAALAFGVAFSRVHTGVHYPTDVLVGSAIGMIVGSMVCTVRPVR
jgi:membrane-associated phospholipid phosphatase